MDLTRQRVFVVAERTAWAIGVIGLLWWGTHHAAVLISTRQDLARFAEQRKVPLAIAKPDQSLWSVARIAAWRETLAVPIPPPLAVLRIAKIGLEVPVLSGTAERTLDRAVGHIEDTAELGTDGNAGIAGHRDGFFRGLKDVVPGDAIELDTREGTEVYRVERTLVVDPEDVSVLDPTSVRALTLVTCYPFYFHGSAPQRFIVRAVRVEARVLTAAR
jgi:sortase A